MKRSRVIDLRLLVATNVALLALLVMAGGSARAANCENDIDCPKPECGGDVCDWGMGKLCRAAGLAEKGADGWCTVDTDCKCRALGATCKSFLCTFTKPDQAPGANAGTGGRAAVGAGGAAGGTGGSAAGVGGSVAAAGGAAGASSAGTGGSTAGPGTTTPKPANDGGGGCALAGNSAPALAEALFGVAAAVGLWMRQRRRYRA